MNDPEQTSPLAELTKGIEDVRQRFHEKYGRLPQELTFVEGDEALAELYSTLLSICVRPEMFVSGGTYAEVAAYVDGIKHGIHLEKKETEAIDGFLRGSFGEWLADRFGTARNVVWSVPIRKAFPDEAEAIVQIPILFARYLHDLRTGLWSQENGPVKKRKPRKGDNRSDA